MLKDVVYRRAFGCNLTPASSVARALVMDWPPKGWGERELGFNMAWSCSVGFLTTFVFLF